MNRMLNRCAGMIAGVASLTVFVSAQAVPSSGQVTTKDLKAGPITTLTGCLAAGVDPTGYSLHHATVTSRPKGMASPAEEPESTTAKTYSLVGGTDLKAHLGHKVTVTGTLDSAASPKPAEKAELSAPSATGAAAAEPMGGTVQVASVAMVARTCP